MELHLIQIYLYSIKIDSRCFRNPQQQWQRPTAVYREETWSGTRLGCLSFISISLFIQVEHSWTFMRTRQTLTVSRRPASPLRWRLARRCQLEWDLTHGTSDMFTFPQQTEQKPCSSIWTNKWFTRCPPWLWQHPHPHRVLQHDAAQYAE